MSWYDTFKEQQILINTSGEHNKFWIAFIDDAGDAHFKWGRIGTSGSSLVKNLHNKPAAASMIISKKSEKTRKGYVDYIIDKMTCKKAKIDQMAFDKLALEAAIIGTQNKCESISWVDEKEPLIPIDGDQLADPSCTPALLVKLQTKKKYYEFQRFSLLFNGETCSLVTRELTIPIVDEPCPEISLIDPEDNSKISKSSDFGKLVSKLEESISRTLFS